MYTSRRGHVCPDVKMHLCKTVNVAALNVSLGGKVDSVDTKVPNLGKKVEVHLS